MAWYYQERRGRRTGAGAPGSEISGVADIVRVLLVSQAQQRIRDRVQEIVAEQAALIQD